MTLKDIQQVYFIGIGGIGMSALARYFRMLGTTVYGYDKTETPLTKMLVGEGINIHYQEDVKQIPKEVDLVVFTPAIPETHKELVYFRENGFPVLKRAEVLGIISRDKRTIAIAGTHGKTTTTSILTHLLKTGGIDCTAFLGGIAGNYNSNFVAGNSSWVVIEADEFDRSFHHLNPEIAAILSMDADHLDIYGTADEVQNSFFTFTQMIKKGGQLFVKDGLKLPESENQKKGAVEVNSFGLNNGTYYSSNIRVENTLFVFDFFGPDSEIRNIHFTLPGNHNVENATAAISIALQLGVDAQAVKTALASFKGIKRRFDIVFKNENTAFIDDYAHHPAELNAAIQAAKTLFPNKKLTGVFQPHLYSRTKDFATDFARALDSLDEILLLDIYPAREVPIPGVSARIIFDEIKNENKKLVSKNNLMEVLKNNRFEVLLTMGAGDISNFVEPIKKLLEDRL